MYVHLSLIEEILSVELTCGVCVCVNCMCFRWISTLKVGLCLFSFLAVQKQISTKYICCLYMKSRKKLKKDFLAFSYNITRAHVYVFSPFML